jgi:hypothetical protein
MRFLLTFTMICALFGVSYAQKTNDTTHNLGKDRDGDTWYLDTDLLRRLDPPADWVIIMPIYSILTNSGLIFFYNVDCSDSTYQMFRARSIDVNGRVIFSDDKRSAWGKWSGYSGRAAKIACEHMNKGRRLPVSNDGRIIGR